MELPKPGEIRTVINKYGKHVFFQDFIRPDGTTSDFLLFEGTTTPAIIFPVTKDGKVIALKQFRFGANEIVLEVPGGNPELHDNLQETITRELMEETGYAPERVTRLADKLYFEPAMVRTSYIPVLAMDCELRQKPHPSRSEFFEVALFSFDEWIKKIMKGEVADSKSIAMTLMALPHLGYKIDKVK